jgi:cytochrome oxidase Cu insertion factor (SCO1/SenC/PrrC family)
MILWIVAGVVAAGWLVVTLAGWSGDAPPRAAGVDGDEGPGVLYPMPAFALTATDGATVTREDLLGGRVVVEFVFTRCKLFCPVMSVRMSQLQAELAGDPTMADVKLVSISVDPEHDTREVLTEYAARYGADPARWMFLRGEDRASVWRLVEQGFKLPVTDESDNAAMPIGHSGNWVIFDAAGDARALVPATQGPTVATAMRTLRAVE